MTPPVETKRPSLDLVISLLSTKTPNGSRFSRRNELSTSLPFTLPLPDSEADKEYFRPRVYGMLDVLSRAVLTDCKQVAAVAASVEPPRLGSNTIHTTLYVSLNPGKGLPTEDQMRVRIQDIVRGLRELTDSEMTTTSHSPKTKFYSNEFMATFYNYGWKRFQHYYDKRIKLLPKARELLEQFKVEHAASSSFGPEEVEHLDFTLRWLESLGELLRGGRHSTVVGAAIAEEYEWFKELVDSEERHITDLFLAYKTFENYLQSNNNFIPIIRWVSKLYSFYIDVRKLIGLATSVRFRSILLGDLDIKVYHQAEPEKKIIECNDKILLETVAYLRQKFERSIGRVKDDQNTLTDNDIVQKLNAALARERRKYFNPSSCVHCEVFLHHRIQSGSILPYIGVSKLSCVPCSIYFELQGGLHPVCTRGSHGKVYPGWTLPSHEVDTEDEERLPSLQTRVRDSLEDLLWRYVDHIRRPTPSDSSVGSDDSDVFVNKKGNSPHVQHILDTVMPRHRGATF